MQTKTCSKCKIELCVTLFHKNKALKDGFQHYCKSCAKEYRALKKPEYAARIKKKTHKIWVENKDKLKQIYSIWYGKNKDSRREYKKEYRSDPEVKAHEALMKKEYNKKNPVKTRAWGSKRRALKRNAKISNFSTSDLEKRMEACGNKCVYCNGPFEEIDHVIPLSAGGKHILANLVPSCNWCNNRKQALSRSVFLQRYNIEIIQRRNNYKCQ